MRVFNTRSEVAELFRTTNKARGCVDLRSTSERWGDCFCAVGLVMDAADPSEWREAPFEDGVQHWFYGEHGYGAVPDDVWAAAVPCLSGPNQQHLLAWANDSGFTFPQLADFLESDHYDAIAQVCSNWTSARKMMQDLGLLPA